MATFFSTSTDQRGLAGGGGGGADMSFHHHYPMSNQYPDASTGGLIPLPATIAHGGGGGDGRDDPAAFMNSRDGTELGGLQTQLFMGDGGASAGQPSHHQGGQLSLSLSTQVPVSLYQYGRPGGMSPSLMSPNQPAAMAMAASRNAPGNMYVQNSRFLRAARELLDEVVSVRDAIKKKGDRKDESAGNGECGKADGDKGEENEGSSSAAELSAAERQDLQNKVTALMAMLDQVDRRYRHYHQQMQMVVSSFDSVAGSGSGVAECCYHCAVELLRDEDEGIRLAAVRLVGLCAEKFATREELGGDADQMDLVFLQLSSMARDMCAKVRTEAFNALAKMQRVSDGVLLQSLSKKIIKTDTGSAPAKKLPPKLIFPCAAGIFAHGIEDEFYQVRTAACKTLGALSRFSNQYAQKALDLLMDMMNDDTEAVRLQTLETLLDMATYGHLSVQEKHMHMFLGILMDANVIVQNAARKILGSVKLPKLQMFKSALDGLIAGLEKNPEDQDIYRVLFSIGKNHGSFSANIAKHLAKEISMASDGELILDKPRIKALLIVSILAPSVDKEKELDIPAVILSHGIPLLGRISCALGEDKQDSLLSSLFHRSGMPFWDKRLVSSEGRDSEGFSVETVDGTHAQIEKTGMKTSYLDEVMIMQSTRLILETVQGAWALRKSCSIGEVRITLRTCKEEVNILAVNSSGSTFGFLSFLCDYIDAVQLIVEMCHFIQSENSYAFGPTSQDILLEKLDTSVRRMKCCYAGLNRELEVQVFEFALLASLFRLSELAIYSELVLDKLHWIINQFS